MFFEIYEERLGKHFLKHHLTCVSLRLAFCVLPAIVAAASENAAEKSTFMMMSGTFSTEDLCLITAKVYFLSFVGHRRAQQGRRRGSILSYVFSDWPRKRSTCWTCVWDA